MCYLFGSSLYPGLLMRGSWIQSTSTTSTDRTNLHPPVGLFSSPFFLKCTFSSAYNTHTHHIGEPLVNSAAF